MYVLGCGTTLLFQYGATYYFWGENSKETCFSSVSYITLVFQLKKNLNGQKLRQTCPSQQVGIPHIGKIRSSPKVKFQPEKSFN